MEKGGKGKGDKKLRNESRKFLDDSMEATPRLKEKPACLSALVMSTFNVQLRMIVVICADGNPI